MNSKLVLPGRSSSSLLLSKLKTLFLCTALLASALPGRAQGNTLVGWGDNRTGQASIPDGLNDIVAISSGEWHNLVQRADGTLVSWGYNAGVPWDVGKVKAFAAGGFHNLAVKPDGTVLAWGDNSNGQCNVPAGLNNVVAVAGSWQHSVALKADGTVVAWGDNRTGQINVPPDLRNVVAISAGEYHNLALLSDGTVRGWGWNGDGQISIPASLGNNVAAISAAGLHSLALKKDGTVVAWGWNRYGQTAVPPGLSNVIAIQAGTEHSLALKADGTVVGWGANDAWGSNDPNCAFTWNAEQCPRVYTGQITPPDGLNNVIAIAAGNFHSIALRRGTAVQAPSAPALTLGSVTETTVTLNWIDLPTETGYRLEARVGANGTWNEIATATANATSYQHTGLTPGTTMFYRLRGFNTGGTSPYSAEVSATTTAAVPPVTPTLSISVQSATEVNLTWNDVANESGYSIERRTSSGQWAQIATPSANATSFRDSGLTPATTYVYRIRALSAAGNSAFSAEVQARTQRLVAPATPTLSAPAKSQSSITLAWTDVADETGYKLEAKTSTGAWIQLATPNAGVTTFEHTALNASTAYTYRISAVNAAGSSPTSSELTVTTDSVPMAGQLTLSVLGATSTGLRVRISGDQGLLFKVQRTTDLKTWNDGPNGALVTSSSEMNLSGDAKGTFYRAVKTQ